MLKIGEFSLLSKTTIKALRYYESEGLLIPAYIDEYTNYRYYEIEQLKELNKIISLRSVGLSIKQIKAVLEGQDLKDVLNERMNDIKENLKLERSQLASIQKMLKEKEMNQEIKIKQLPECVVYSKEGTIENYDALTQFVLGAGEECSSLNPGLECTDYCYVEYLDDEHKETNIKVRYSEAVSAKGNGNENIKFSVIPSIKAVTIEHHGSYSKLGESYEIILEYIKKNGIEMAALPREVYIDGCWNKENEDDYLTEIQFPIK